MTAQPGDTVRIKHIATSTNHEYVGRVGVLEAPRNAIRYHRVVGDDGLYAPVLLHEVEVVTTEDSDDESLMNVFNKYVAEFDKIIANGTAVPRHTAMGFLYHFIEDVKKATDD